MPTASIFTAFLEASVASCVKGSKRHLPFEIGEYTFYKYILRTYHHALAQRFCYETVIVTFIKEKISKTKC